MWEDLERVVVVGTTGCGKTALARRLARALGCQHIELDELYWSPRWVARPLAEFRRRTQTAVREQKWIADGNYAEVRDVLWARATALIWLNYSFSTVFARVFGRTVRRIIFRETMFSGNRESFGKAFLSCKSILLWMITTFHSRRRRYEQLRHAGESAHLRGIEFRRPSDAERFLQTLEKQLGLLAHSDAAP